MSDSAALLLLFVVLPFVLAFVVIAYVSRRAPQVRPGARTSELLAEGVPAQGRLVKTRNHATSFIDRRPMVAFTVVVFADQHGPETELTITQSVPVGRLGEFRQGMTLDLRLTPDRTAGAIVLPMVAE